MAGEVKIMSEEQHDLIMNDLAKFIGEIQKIREELDGPKMRKEIVNEFKVALSKNHSLFKSIEREELELEKNLDALKNVRREFYDCKFKIETRLIIAVIGSMFMGSVITISMYWFMGKFG